ncbi:HNH endonuclease [Natrialbaceae archaeon A-chndr2]
MQCPTCGKQLATEGGVRQHHTKVHGDPLSNRTCTGCGLEFYDPKSRRSFCDGCNPNVGEHNGNWSDAKAETTCKTCGGTFEYSPSDTSGVYCSDCVSNADGLLPKNPSSAGKRITVDCNGCGSELSVYPSRVERNERGVFCDMACYGRWLSRTIVGENHHQWAGGPITYGRKWWTIRRQVLERDDYRCQRCGRSRDDIGRNPDVHHLVPVRSFDDTEDAHTLANVIALCRRCHRLAEEDQISMSLD